LIELLKSYIERSDQYELEIISVGQKEKLSQIKSGKNIDALLFTFSKTTEREDTIVFSKSYFQNKALGVITKDPSIDISNIKEQTIEVGYVDNTRAKTELKILKKKYENTLILSPVGDHKELIQQLERGEIDAAAGDISRLIYDLGEGDFYFGGNIPTRGAKRADNYCIGITKQKAYLKPFFDQFLTNSEKEIEQLESKWLSTSLDEAYQRYYNKEKKEFDLFKEYTYIASFLILMLFAFIIIRINKGKNKQIEKLRNEGFAGELKTITKLYEAKGKASVGAAEIAEIGSNYFKTAEKKITYVGSGGFLSDEDEELREKWLSSMNEFLKKPGVTFERVVDLPQTEVNDQNEIRFSEIYNFYPKGLPKHYISKYLRWICIQYAYLKTYANLKIIDSRGAALWGYGIIIMIKDEDEVLIFTTDKKTKIGSSIHDEKLAKNISNIISEVKEVGWNVTADYLKQEFLSEDPRLEEVRELIDELEGKPLTKEISKKIDITCAEIQKTNQ
jgi:hypothetical protein